MGYCKIHGDFSDNTCWECWWAEEEAKFDRLEMIGEIIASKPDEAAIAHGINNPGDYECPSCRFQTLRLDAARCPKCQSNISSDYWIPIRRQLTLQREAEERRAEIEAEAFAQAALDREAKATAEREAKDRQRLWTVLGWTGVAVIVIGLFAAINRGSTTPSVPFSKFTPSPVPAIPIVPPRARMIFYSVTGVARGDSLNVRRGPGANNAISAKLPNGFHGIRIVGAPIMNGTTEWVQIEFRDGNGWVTRQYLQPE